MRFWDSSAVVPLLIRENHSERIGRLALEEEDMVVWWATPVECTSAITRREGNRDLDPETANLALARLRDLATAWSEILPSERLRAFALRLLRVHVLRAADALQLAAAVIAAGEIPVSLEVVCLDQRLARAAEREGFRVIA